MCFPSLLVCKVTKRVQTNNHSRVPSRCAYVRCRQKKLDPSVYCPNTSRYTRKRQLLLSWHFWRGRGGGRRGGAEGGGRGEEDEIGAQYCGSLATATAAKRSGCSVPFDSARSLVVGCTRIALQPGLGCGCCCSFCSCCYCFS